MLIIEPGPLGVLPRQWRMRVAGEYVILEGSFDGLNWAEYNVMINREGSWSSWELAGPLAPDDSPPV